MDAPEARYLDRDGAVIAYQVVGDRGPDVLVIGEIAQHFDLAWTDPHMHELYDRAATYSRTGYMQPRGFGLSDPIGYAPTLDQHADDILAVLDDADMPRATLFATLTTCAAAALVAARSPERVSGLVLFKPLPCGPLAPGALEHGWTPQSAEAYAQMWRRVFERWGSGSTLDGFDPVQSTAFNRRLMALLERCSATPAAARRHLEWALQLDQSDVLRAVRTPTRVVYQPTGQEPEAVVRHVAELIPTASFHALSPTLPGAAIGEAFGEVWRLLEEVATGGPRAGDPDRYLGTVLFTDVVGSTELLAELGDARYSELRATHERQVRLLVERHGGRLVNVTGDGTLSVFDGPTQAVRCAIDVGTQAGGLGLAIRAGVHTGELQRTGTDVTGLAVHIGARVAAAAGSGDVLVSQTVRDLVAGSELRFAERGSRELRGVPGSWALFAVVPEHTQAAASPAERSLETPLDRAALKTAQTAPWAVRAALRVGNTVQRYRARAARDRAS